MDRPKATDRQEHPRRRPTDKWPAAKTPPSHDAKAEPKKETSKEADLTADRKRSTYSPEKVQKKPHTLQHEESNRKKQHMPHKLTKKKHQILTLEKYRTQETCE
jgi:hypothetical protein